MAQTIVGKSEKREVNPKDSTQILFWFYSGEVFLSSVRFIKHRVKALDFSGLLRKMYPPDFLRNKNRRYYSVERIFFLLCLWSMRRALRKRLLVCHATQLRTGTESPFDAKGQIGLQKPWICYVFTSFLMLSRNSGEKTQVATSHLQNAIAACVCPLCTLSQRAVDHMAGCTFVQPADVTLPWWTSYICS